MASKLTPMQAVRKTCLYCAGTSQGVRECDGQLEDWGGKPMTCPLHPLRFGRRVKGISPVKAIRRRCLWCSYRQLKVIEDCPEPECLSYPYRFGVRPETAARREKKVDV